MRVMKNPLLERIRSREAKVGVVGLGYVGLPLGMAFAEAGFPVLGLDIDARKVEHVERGESYIKHIPTEALQKAKAGGKLRASTDFAKLAELDFEVACFGHGMPMDKDASMEFRRLAEKLAT